MVQDQVVEFVDRDLQGARFTRSTLAGAVMRGVDCLHVILDEEWEHLRFALRDLTTVGSARTGNRRSSR